MKAIVVHQYGGPEELKFEDYRDPVAGAGQALIKTAATSVNPMDVKRRSGAMKDAAPIQFPGILGVDISGTVVALGPGVKDVSVGDKVLGMADQTYAELCAVPAANLVRVPAGLDRVEAAALPLVTTTGNQLISLGTAVGRGQRVLVTGAAGNVGRSAVFTAKARGAYVIAGVRRAQLRDAAALGADEVVAIDDDAAVSALPLVDAVADTVNGDTAAKLMARVKSGGVFASVLGPPRNAAAYTAVRAVPIFVRPDAKVLSEMVQAVEDGQLTIPISRKLPLKDAPKAHAAVEQGIAGKVLLVSDGSS
jgi:NADPH:quinone reductase-like Zn-dependent oxidoreductase